MSNFKQVTPVEAQRLTEEARRMMRDAFSDGDFEIEGPAPTWAEAFGTWVTCRIWVEEEP